MARPTHESWPGLITSHGQAYSRVMDDDIGTFYSMQVNVINKIINEIMFREPFPSNPGNFMVSLKKHYYLLKNLVTL